MGSRLDKQSRLVRKRIEHHTFDNELGEEYEGSEFCGFSEYFRRKRLKLQNLDIQIRSNSIDKPPIFRGIVVHVNGYTQPSLSDIHNLVVSHGGGFAQYLDGKTSVTHIIAANLTPKKAAEFCRYRIVKPAWIVDSVIAGRVLSWADYNVLHKESAQQLLGVENGKVVNQTNKKLRSYTEQTNKSWYSEQVKEYVDLINKEKDPRRNDTISMMNCKHDDSIIDNHHQKNYGENSNNSDHDSITSEEFEITSTLEEVLDSTRILRSPSTRDKATDNLPVDTYVQIPSSPTSRSTDEKKFEEGPICHMNQQLKETTICHTKTNSIETKRKTPVEESKELTAEEHNAILLADPNIRKSTATNPDFITKYYSESRLHHLSTWKAELKSRLQKITSEKSSLHKRYVRRKPGDRRYILHVDFDSFFCAVSLKNAPEWIDKPAAVAHGCGNGAEIASCNYPARAFGVKNGMWMKNALKLCPQIKVLPYDFPAYEATSNLFYQEILNTGGVVQSVSVDEALIDITNLCQASDESDAIISHNEVTLHEQVTASSIARDLRLRIKKLTGFDISVGIGPNILLAKVALRKAKPAGQFQLIPDDVSDFIGNLSVRDLPGVASSIGGKLEEKGIHLVKDIRKYTKNHLMTLLGPRTGEKIWEYSQGIDQTEVGEQVCRKSVSAEVNWGIRFINQQEAEEFVQNLCIELHRRLVDQKARGRQLTMKIMRRSPGAPLNPQKHLGHGICDTFNKSVLFGVATNNSEIIAREAISMLRSYRFSPGDLRGLGVQMAKLEPLKVKSMASPEGSQKRFNFGASKFSKKAQSPFDDPIDDMHILQEQKETPNLNWKNGVAIEEVNHNQTRLKTPKSRSYFVEKEDPIDKDSPQKIKVTPIHPASLIARINSTNTKFSPKPLNVTGTQFIIPSQIDPGVLGELPEDIQLKLIAQSNRNKDLKDNVSTDKSQVCSLPEERISSLPPQLDPEVFAALPNDMKAEVLASYGICASAKVDQPRSPLKTRTLRKPISNRLSPSKRRGRNRPSGLKAKHDPQQLSLFSLKDSFKIQSAERRAESGDRCQPELDPNFLSALPDDVRIELLDEKKRQQQKFNKSEFCTSFTINKKRPVEKQPPPRKLVLPERKSKPTFTTQKLSSLPQLRETISAWYKESSSDGPHPDDVAAIIRYLRRVVLDERDLAKVVGVTRWLGYLISESKCNGNKNDSKNNGPDIVTKIWTSVHESIKNSVQIAVQERGLGNLDL
ncbi:DNA repair protein REV1 [Golovinomyces cichoracearum]|uniref:DNA repair protein REV1 n=1 Tax=Golovinomyces cichoracearum TaxID=62708 RepID=A0A420I9Q1_9PEZI|nr:DNA repair protein REV1 [Golovinomyces cichoracearum]